MMARRTFGGLALMGLAAVLGGCSGRVSTLRYRLTVEVNTPNGVKTGSSVLEDAFSPGNSYEFSASERTYGEAPTVDLGGGRYLFALLSGPGEKRSMQNMISRMFDYPEYPSPVESIKLVDRFAEANNSKPVIIIKPEDYPMLVTFGDINDPKTVREVDPGIVRRMTVQVMDADEPLTEGMETEFPQIASKDMPFRPTDGLEVNRDDPAGRLQNTSFVWRKK